VAQWLAGGAHGVGYFTYWTPPPVYGYEWGPAMIEWGTGARTEYYDIVTALNARLAPLGDTLAVLRWLATEHAGSVPAGGVPFSPDTVVRAVEGRATLGWFADSCGTTYLFLASADSLSPRTVTLALAGGWQPARLDDDGATWDPLDFDGDGRIGLTLAGGDFTLLRFPPRSSPAGVQPPPGPAAGALRVTPNPAPGRVRFDISGAGASARLEVMDLAGRVVWSRAVPPGGSALTWSGERGAPGGVYFVRLRDRRGTAVRRFVRMDRR
jgi:hypothetical protein